MEFYIVPSLHQPNAWFVIRENGVEVKVVIKQDIIISDTDLQPEEEKQFRNHFLKKIQID